MICSIFIVFEIFTNANEFVKAHARALHIIASCLGATATSTPTNAASSTTRYTPFNTSTTTMTSTRVVRMRATLRQRVEFAERAVADSDSGLMFDDA